MKLDPKEGKRAGGILKEEGDREQAGACVYDKIKAKRVHQKQKKRTEVTKIARP